MCALSLGARYRVVGEIASGGMGTVLLAVKRENGAPVAAKKLHAHLVDDPDVVAGFVDEARIASRLVHPNVVHVQDVEMIGDALVIVMDYVEGVALSTLLRLAKSHGEELPVAVVRRILVDALRGLHAAHELRDENGSLLSVVHRDVSPHNLLVGLDGVTRVTDFGVAMASGRVASTHADRGVKGKLQYLSPEQIYRRPLDRRADVFASGIVAWEALTGRRLFGAGTEAETLAMVLREPITPPSTYRLDVGLDLDEATLRALERDPERRFETADAFARALEAETLADRAVVAQFVERAAGEDLAERRRQLEAARARGGLAVATAAEAIAPRPLSRRSRPFVAIGLVLLGSVAGGVIVSLVMRAPTAPVVSTAIAPATVAERASSETIELSDNPPAPAATQTTASTGTPRAKSAPKVRRSQPDAGSGRRPFIPEDL